MYALKFTRTGLVIGFGVWGVGETVGPGMSCHSSNGTSNY